jgi:hypothetical protein
LPFGRKRRRGKKKPQEEEEEEEEEGLFLYQFVLFHDSAVEVMMRRKRTKIVEMSSRSEQPGKNRQKQIRVNNKIQKIRNRST